MTFRSACAPQWPISIDRDAAGGATVLLEDGRRGELDAFRDGCRDSAQALRREAMNQAWASTAAALRRMSNPAARLLRPVFARKSGAPAPGA